MATEKLAEGIRNSTVMPTIWETTPLSQVAEKVG